MKIRKLSMAVAAGVMLSASCPPPFASVKVPVSGAPPAASGDALDGSIRSQVDDFRRA